MVTRTETETPLCLGARRVAIVGAGAKMVASDAKD